MSSSHSAAGVTLPEVGRALANAAQVVAKVDSLSAKRASRVSAADNGLSRCWLAR
ncbi:hypothetical protein D3C76_1473190 [compost metagenome]